MTVSRHLLIVFALLVSSIFGFAAEQDENGVYTKFDKNPTPTRTPPPEFPDAMKGTSGIVAVLVIIDEKGSVESASVSKSSNPEFDKPSLDAIKKWKFKPAEVGGQPVKAKVTIPLHFKSEG